MVMIPVSPGGPGEHMAPGRSANLWHTLQQGGGRNIPSTSSRKEVQGSCPVITGKKQVSQPVQVETKILIWLIC